MRYALITLLSLVPTVASAAVGLSDFVEFTGVAASDTAGDSVASAGDVDNDGYDDVLVGATSAASDAGAAYLIYGQSSKLSSASLSTAVEFTGEASSDQAGYSVAGAGDVNNDGYDDFLIGAYRNDTAASDAGATYLLYGSATRYSGTQSLSSAAKFTGEAENDFAGFSVAGAGDVNNDGYDDFLVGAYGNDDVGSVAGITYLLYGQSSKYTGTQSLSTAAEFTGESAADRSGYSVAGAGDVNNDGYSDVLIGAYRRGALAGATYLVYGQSSNYTGTTSLSAAAEFTGEVAGDLAGYSVAGAGDVNNDGYDDFLVGAYGNDDAGSSTGATYLVYGQSSSFTGSTSLSTAVEFTGEAVDDEAGTSVHGTGDLNNDGYSDLLIGAQGNDDGGAGAGAVYLIYGQATALTSASLTTAIEFTGEAASDLAGYSVAGAGDVNNDGYDDFLIGARHNDDGANNAGAAYVGYHTIDADRDGVAGTTGLLATGSDCNDSDSTVSSNQTYYQDSDGDGLGSDTTTSTCSSTAPAGYVSNSNDTNDADADNDGTATSSDCNDADSTIASNQTYYQDSDGDGLGSDTTTSVCSLTAPAGYAANSDDTDDTIAFSEHTVSTVIGAINGAIAVTYNDATSATYTIFTVTTDKITLVTAVPDSNLVVAVHPKARKISLVDGLSGEIHHTKTLNDKSHSKIKLVIKDLRSDDKYEAVVVAKRKTKLVHVHLFSIQAVKLKLKKRDDATVKHKKIIPSKTKVKTDEVRLRSKTGKTLVTYRVTKQYHLHQ